MKKWGTLIVLLLAIFVIIVDTTMMNVSITALVNDLHTTVSGVQSAISIYALVMASFILVGAKLGDILGPRKTFLIGSIIYCTGTSIAAISHSLGMLILGWSIIEGIGSALMLPNIQVLLRKSYDGKDRATGYAALGAMMALASASGPIIGGFFTTYYSWRYGFALEVIIIIIILALSGYLIKDKVIIKRPKLDVVGAMLSGFGFAGIILGILLAQTYGLWLAKKPLEIGGLSIAPFGLSVTPFLIAGGIFLLIMFYFWEERMEKENKLPLVKPTLFKNRPLNLGLSVQFIQLVITAGFLFVYPLYLQISFNKTAMETGFAMIPYSIAVLIFSFVGVRMSQKKEAKKIIKLGYALSGIGFLAIALNIKPGSGPTDIIIGSTILGSGLGLISSQVVNFVISTVKPEETADAAGLNGTIGQLGNSIGVAFIGGILIMTLISGITKGVDQSTTLTPSEQQVVNDKIQEDVEVVSDQQLTNYLESNNVDPAKQDELIAINSVARSQAFSAAVIFMAFISLIGFIISTRLPSRKLV